MCLMLYIKGMSVANFGMQRAKSERNIGEIANHIPPAPMSNVEKIDSRVFSEVAGEG